MKISTHNDSSRRINGVAAWLAAFALICAATAQAVSWDEVVTEGTAGGLDRGELERVVDRCREAGYEPDAVRDVLRTAEKAAAAGLPAKAILEKIEEGVAKRVDGDSIQRVAENRYQFLEQSQKILRESGIDDGARASGLVVASAKAMESGLSAGVIGAFLKEGRDASPERLAAVVNAGEELHLSGFTAQETGALMNACIQRNLRESEVRRTIRSATRSRKRGMDFESTEKALWGRREYATPQGQAAGGRGPETDAVDGSGAPSGAPFGPTVEPPAQRSGAATAPGAPPSFDPQQPPSTAPGSGNNGSATPGPGGSDQGSGQDGSTSGQRQGK